MCCFRPRYGSSLLPKAALDDPEFQAMNQAFYVSGGGKGTAPFLTTQGLRAFIEAEYGIFKAYVKHLVLLLLEHTEGNPSGQGLHDCATLENRFKCLALGLQLVDPQMKQKGP